MNRRTTAVRRRQSRPGAPDVGVWLPGKANHYLCAGLLSPEEQPRSSVSPAAVAAVGAAAVQGSLVL